MSTDTAVSRMLAIFNGMLKNQLNANSKQIKNLAEPTEDNDAATKKWVMEHGGGAVQWDDILNKPTFTKLVQSEEDPEEYELVQTTDEVALSDALADMLSVLPQNYTIADVISALKGE